LALTRDEIITAINDPDWQAFRLRLLWLKTEQKLARLDEWLARQKNSRKAQVQVENYKNALRRAGQLE
jgi:hypothetical protein